MIRGRNRDLAVGRTPDETSSLKSPLHIGESRSPHINRRIRRNMGHSLLKWRSVAIVAAIAALVFVIACGTDEPEPAPAVDTAKLIQDAVASAQSASAAEYRSR